MPRERKDENPQDQKKHREDEDQLIDLALKWNYFDGVLPLLQNRQNELLKGKKEFNEVRLT